MRHHAVLGLVVALSGCVAGEEPASVAEADLLGTPCPDWGCGINSPQIDNSFFHELNVDGVVNLEGYTLLGASKTGGIYDVSVEDARMIARLRVGTLSAPRVLTGESLEGLALSLRRFNAATGTTRHYTLVVESVSNVVEYRATPPGGSTPPTIETYKLYIQSEGPFGAYLCQNGPELLSGEGPRQMARYSAVVFEGERIDAKQKTIAPVLSSRWFNIGCAESAVAKLHLHGHTHASRTAGFDTTIAERQTMLKMLVGDYCGTGKPFTVTRQPLDWEDDQHTMVMPASIPKALEARWRPYGAACLNTPRVVAHPSDEAAEAFPEGVERAIAAECVRPPTCSAFTTSYHLKSYNRTPFTN
jgi:hypothetical protein